MLYPFVPGTDDKSPNPFLPIPIEDAAKKGMNVPYLVGYNNREGIYALAGNLLNLINLRLFFNLL